MPYFNGKTKIGLSVAGLVAVLAAMFTAGANYRTLTVHTEDAERHENATQKERRIDERVRLHILPVEVKLDQMDKKIDRLLDERRKP